MATKAKRALETLEPGRVQLLLDTATRASGKAAACVRRVPETQTVKLSDVKKIVIESAAANKQDIEILMLPEALELFRKHPLKPKPDDEDGRLAVTIKPGKTAAFQLSGKTGSAKYDTNPSRCSGAHHDDFHIEC